MIGFFKNLFSGVLSFFVGLFGGKKSQENKPSITSSAEKLAEATAKASSEVVSSLTDLTGGKKPQENKPSTKAAEKPAAATAKNRKRSGYFMELDEAEDVKPGNGNQPSKEIAAAKTPEPVAAAKPAKPEPAKTPEPAATAQAAKIELVQTAEGIKAQPAKPASSSPAASTNGQNQTETTFAPKYLAPSGSSNSRRRPGPSMNPFLDMARQVKNPG